MKRLEILKTLHTTPYKERKDRNPCRVPGTLEWFVEHESFRQWNDASASTMLWVSADPGAGKSVLARHLVDHELTQQRNANGDVVRKRDVRGALIPNASATVCYFFFKDDFEDQRSAKEAVSCIIHQLLTERNDLFTDKILDRFETGGGYDRQSFHDLWDILITTLLQAPSGQREQERNPADNAPTTHPPLHVLCVLDAFDECNLTDQRTLAKALGDFYAGPVARNSNVVLKFLVTSRPYRNIEQEFRYDSKLNVSFMRLSGEGPDEVAKIQNEIGIYIRAKLDSIAREHNLSAAETRTLHDKVLQIPHRTYLWVYLTLDLIQREFDEDMDLDMAMSDLPKDVDDAYEKILARIKPKDVDKARRLLHIIVAAVRPLTLDELNFALALKKGDTSYGDVKMVRPDRFPRYIRNLCGLFVTVVDARVYLLHQTAKTFLVGQGGATTRPRPVPPSSGLPRWKASLEPGESHYVLAKIAIWHLHFTTFKGATSDTEMLSLSDYYKYKDKHVFLEYSACNWPSHFRQSNGPGNDEDVLSLLSLCGPSADGTVTWLDIYSAYGHNYVVFDARRILVVAAFCGLDNVVGALLARPGIDANATDKMYQRSALHWASNHGFDKTVEQLLAHAGGRMHINAKDLFGRTPMAIASQNGFEAIVRLLLNAGADVHATDWQGESALMYAAAAGHPGIADVLLQAGADANSVGTYGHTALLFAVERGDAAIVQRLVKAGAKMHLSDGIRNMADFHVLMNDQSAIDYPLDEPKAPFIISKAGPLLTI
ncbi:ankyrin repeat-containing protein [Sporothrix schenckii 1099-18]|uniref:Ankyrin repeat-containing protein n=1 Tax=Sporothrix schenckii 1099-18 TaxID=1397361 RepID=A0A0F2MKB8_SPOSC|nr:ankyrin repeat-containing protein [Sporothrix schenckii 1099-18]KJR89285.1 ankyrin repeat-containing protein [Sporothrix schenckii 1099-18]